MEDSGAAVIRQQEGTRGKHWRTGLDTPATTFRYETAAAARTKRSAPPLRFIRTTSSRCLFVGVRLQPAKIISGFLRMRCCGEDSPLVVLQHFQPVGDISGVILPDFRGEIEIGAQKRAAQFRDQLFHRIPGIAPFLAAKVTVKAGFMPRPMGAFMGERGVIAFGIAERLKGRHLHEISTDIVIGHVAAMADISTGGSEKAFRPLNPLHRVKPWLGKRVKVRGQSFNLLDIEHGIGFQEWDRGLRLLAGFLIGAGARKGAGIDNTAAALAFADMRV